MRIARTRHELAAARADLDGRVAFVPTMGNLHAGHVALIDAAHAHADHVVASVFVNPLQFGEGEDFDRYPRTPDADRAALAEAGADLAFMPTADELLVDGESDVGAIAVPAKLGDVLEGASRPGHFDGVATVVAKLFIACLPDVAIFGEKDWQQLAVIRRMTVDLGLPIQIVGHPTVREEDGLAMSSRNALLSEDERERATLLSEALETARDCILAGGSVEASLDIGMALLEAGDFKIDYLAYVDGDTLEPLDGFRPDGRLIAAASLGKVRLIDNVRVLSATG